MKKEKTNRARLFWKLKTYLIGIFKLYIKYVRVSTFRSGRQKKKKKKPKQWEAFVGPVVITSPELKGRSESALHLRAKHTQHKK